MKTLPKLPRRLLIRLLPGLLPLAAAGLAPAAEDILIDDFRDPATAAKVGRFWGAAIQTYSHDPAEDATDSPTKGALKVVIDYNLATYAGDNQFAARRELDVHPVDGSQYAKLEFDIKYAATSVAQGTHYGNLEVGIAHEDWSQYNFGTIRIPVGTNTWQHVSLTVDKNNVKLNTLRDFFFKTWSGDASSGMTGTSTFWIDNVKLIAIPSTEPPPPPPSTTLTPAVPGLNLITSGAGQYSRQGVRTLSPEYSWVGAASPVTYSITVSEYPRLANHQSKIYLVPGTGLAATVTDPDWNRPLCAVFSFSNNADGSGSMSFSYKNHLANSNGPGGHEYWINDNPADLYDGVTPPETMANTGKGGQVAWVASSRMIGTWKVTFTSDTAMTLTAPDGSTGNGMLPNQATANLFANPLYAYFSTLPQETANIGQRVIFSDLAITGGVANPLNVDLEAWPLDPALEKAGADAPGVVQVTLPETPYWLSWSLPAVGYIPQQSASLGNDILLPWADLPMTEVISSPGQRRLLLKTDSLQNLGIGKGFFRLIKP